MSVVDRDRRAGISLHRRTLRGAWIFIVVDDVSGGEIGRHRDYEDARSLFNRIAENLRRSTVEKCRSCGARVFFAKTRNNRDMPIDFEPVADGNVWITDGVARVGTPPDGVERYVSHYATCPNGPSHRRKR